MPYEESSKLGQKRGEGMFEDLLAEGSSGRRVASFDAGHHI